MRSMRRARSPRYSRSAAEQVAVLVVEQVAADVQVLALAVERRDLGGRDERDAVVGGGVERLGDAVDRVVIGQREQLDAGGGRARDHLGGRQRAVALGGVGLQVEGRGHG